MWSRLTQRDRDRPTTSPVATARAAPWGSVGRPRWTGTTPLVGASPTERLMADQAEPLQMHEGGIEQVGRDTGSRREG